MEQTGNMKKMRYVTEEEQERCRKVADAFEELIQAEDDSIMVDMGKYGFAKMEGFKYPESFEQSHFYTDT